MQPAWAFAERMRLGQLTRFADDLGVPSAGEIGLEPPFEGECAQLLEPVRDRSDRRLLREVDERRPAPERERLAERVGGLGRPSLVERDAALVEQSLEAGQVERVRLDPDGIAGAAGLDRLPAERLAQLRT